MWTYRQRSGELMAADGAVVATGYSGHGDGVNNPNMQSVANVGPCPCGVWSIGPPQDTTTHGPYVMALTAHDDTETFGRSGFLLHGDEVAHAGEEMASLGCIVLPRAAREQMWGSGDHLLVVVG